MTDPNDDLEFYFQHRYRARIPHTCGHCGKPITPGSRYLHTFYKLFGEPPATVNSHNVGYCQAATLEGDSE